jgi:hypothetical protein
MSETAWTELAGRRLERVLGPTKGPATMAEVLSELGLTHLRSEEDLGRFGEALARRGGFLAPLGASIQTLAFMHRARPVT